MTTKKLILICAIVPTIFLLLAMTVGLFHTPELVEDLYLNSETIYGKTEFHYYLSRITEEYLGHYIHIPSLLFLQSILATVGASLLSYKIIYFLLNLLALSFLQFNLLKNNKLDPFNSFLLGGALATLPIVSYSFFKLEAFTIGYLLGLAFLIDYRNKSAIKIGLLFMISTFISEVAMVFPIAFAVVDLAKQRSFKRFICISLPSILIIITWFILESQFASRPFSLMERTHSTIAPSFSHSLTVMGDYIIRFFSDYSLQLIVLIIALIFTFKKNFIGQIKSLHFTSAVIFLSALEVLAFFFIYSHYHPKDILGFSILIFFLLSFKLLQRQETVAKISVLLIIFINIATWFLFPSNYHSPLLVFNSQDAGPIFIQTIENNYSISPQELSVSKELESYLREGLDLPIKNRKENKAKLVLLNRLEFSKAQRRHWCPLHVFYFQYNQFISEEPVRDCSLESITTDFSNQNILERQIFVLYKR